MSTQAVPLVGSGTGHLWRSEAKALISLAFPLILVNLGWALIASTDLFWLGRLGPEAVASGALALNLYQPAMIFGIGLITACSPLIASERGRRLHSIRDIRRTVRQGLWAVSMLSAVAWALFSQGEAILLALGQERHLAAGASELLGGLKWALPTYLGFLVLRNFVSALERPYWSVVVMLAAIPFNALMGWLLIFGPFGLPVLGLFGAGLATSFSTAFLFFGMALVVALDRRFRRYHLFGRFWAADWVRLRTIARIGLPIATMLTLEMTVFNGATLLMGLLGEASLAAHAIAMQISMPCFMVPIGVAQAAAVRVALAQGRQDAAAVGRAGWIAYLLGTGFACLSAILLLAMPRTLVGIFLDVRLPGTVEVMRLAVSFLMVAALYQLADSAQAVGAGALRGLQDTRAPMLFAMIGYWVVGLGSGALLAFPLKRGGIGIWYGLALGLLTVACLMLVRWARRDRLPQMPRG